MYNILLDLLYLTFDVFETIDVKVKIEKLIKENIEIFNWH